MGPLLCFSGGLEGVVFKQDVFLHQAKSAEEAFEICFEAWGCSHLGCFN